MNLTCVLAAFISFIIVVVSGKFMIPVLRRLKAGNTEREELESHQKKNGTPSMGGLMILLGIVITSLIFMKKAPDMIPIMLVTLAFGIIGFVDDYLKAVKKKSDGFKAWQKMLCQIAVTVGYYFYLKSKGTSLLMIVPFVDPAEYMLDLKWFAIVVFFLAVIGTVNGVNLNDGVDGMCSSVTAVVAGFFGICALFTDTTIAPICFAVIGALLGFLMYNFNPAKIFMGDTGSLALGGFVSAVAYSLNMPIFIIIVGFIYWAEILSVMIQVGVFKLTKGKKRVFKMAPIHHSFELSGYSETQVVGLFTVVTVLMCLIGFIGYFGI